MNIYYRFLAWLSLWAWGQIPDECEKCHGKRGGVRGNENVIDGHVVCDYCSAESI